MDLVCTRCNDTLDMNEFLGTLNHPFCKDCWDKTWKGKEETFVFSLFKTNDESDIQEKLLTSQ